MDYLFTTLALIGVYCILALSTNFLMGYAGIFTMAQGAVFGVGAYSVALLMKMGFSFWPSLLVAVLAASICNILITLPSLRAGGLYFIVASFGFQVIMSDLFLNLGNITGGNAGIPGIPKPVIFGLTIDTPLKQAIFVGIFLLVFFYLAHRLFRSPFGELVEAMRQEETAVEALGKSILNLKVVNAILGGVYAGIAGGLYAPLISYIDPSSFDVHTSFYTVVLVVIGGAATLLGSIVGPVVLVILPQLISFLPVDPTIAGPMKQMIYGVLLILFMLFRPEGLITKKKINLVTQK